jgi:hypothetical protein
MLAKSPPLPLIIYWGNPGTLDTEKSTQNVVVALRHRDRVRRMTLHMSEDSLRNVFSSMNGPFPMLETLQVYCSSLGDSSFGRSRSPATLPSMFEAPNLRHLQISDLNLMPLSTKLLDDVATRPSIVTLTVGEITTKPAALMECLALMPHLKVLKIGVFFSIPSEPTERKERGLCAGSQPESPPLALTELEEFEYQGISDYLEAVAARISAPFLKKLSITVTNSVNDNEDLDTTTFKYLSRFISGAANLAFQYARVRFKDGFSIVLDHDELWTGRGAFELRFNDRGYHFDADIGLAAEICRAVAPMPSSVQSLLLEDAHRNRWERKPDHDGWHDLFRVFDNVKTLRVAGRFVGELDKVLAPYANDEGLAALLRRLEEIVRYGPEDEFAAFVQARQVSGSPVRVVSGPKNRLTLF